MHDQVLMFIQDLAIIMMIASLATIVCFKLKQPLVIGYIVSGIIIGSHTPPFSLLGNETTIKTLAELGVIFLMFSLGLEFNLRKLKKVGAPAIITALLEIIVMIGIGYLIGNLFGWSKINSLFLGAILSISSTTIIVKTLDELNLKHKISSQLIFGILIVEDIFAILILALLSSIATTGSLDTREVLMTSIKLSSFLVVALLTGILVIPSLLNYINRFKNNEILLITILGLCFGFCLIVIKLNYSVALGAFIIGAIIAEFRQINKVEHLIQPIRDMFSSIFFVSVGLLFNPSIVLEYLWPVIVITTMVVIGKVISCSLGIMISGRDGKTAMRVGMGMAQIGEFSFIIASLGIALGVTDNFLYSIAVCVSIITTLLTPYLVRYSDSATKFLAKFVPKSITEIFSVYSNWIKHINPESEQIIIKNVIKRSIGQIIINLLIIVAIFLAGSYIAKTDLGDFVVTLTSPYAKKPLIWAGALILSLPFLIATYNKVKALSMLLAELSIREKLNHRLPGNVRRVISEIIPIIFICLTMVLISILSASILPSVELLIIILIVVAALIAIILPWLIKIHSKLQINLIKSFKKESKDIDAE